MKTSVHIEIHGKGWEGNTLFQQNKSLEKKGCNRIYHGSEGHPSKTLLCDPTELTRGSRWETKAFTITMVNAAHTSDIMGEEYKKEGRLTAGSGFVGYVIEFKNGPSIYYGGDTGVFGDMAIIRDLYSPDVAILPVGGKYNMGYREAGYAASLIHPKLFIPIHYDTFPNQRLYFGKLVEEIKFRAPHVTVVRWKPGATYEYK